MLGSLRPPARARPRQDMRRLKNKFELVDSDLSGNIDYREFFGMIGAEETHYTDAIYEQWDVDNRSVVA